MVDRTGVSVNMQKCWYENLEKSKIEKLFDK